MVKVTVGDNFFAASQRTQIIRHVAELSQHRRIVEIAGRRIARATERDCTSMTQHFPRTLRPLYRGCGAQTFNRLTNNDAAVRDIERLRDEICNSGHDTQPARKVGLNCPPQLGRTPAKFHVRYCAHNGL